MKNSSKVGIFKRKIGRELSDMIDKQLLLQVDVSFDVHCRFLVKQGLDKCSSVLDVGTGNGYFCCRLAEEYPKIQFTGIDFKDEMIERSKRLSINRGLKNVSWFVNDISAHKFDRAGSLFDGILLRYADVYIPDIVSTLDFLRTLLRKGGHIWIISLDLDHMFCKPSNEAFDIYKRGTEQLFKSHGMDPHIAAKIPFALKTAGYDSIITELDPMTPQSIGLEAYQKYMLGEATLFHNLDSEALSVADLNKIEDFVKNVVPLPDYHGTYGTVMIAAQK